MLLTEAEDSPLKAVDFGLAVAFDPAALPRTDLGLEGTAWYMAPEVLASEARSRLGLGYTRGAEGTGYGPYDSCI
jgi:serine/threonine protein kinase